MLRRVAEVDRADGAPPTASPASSPRRRRAVVDPDGERVVLTGAEFDLLCVFLDRPGRVLSRDQLLDLTQGREADPLDRSIDVLMSRLRRKLGDGGSSRSSRPCAMAATSSPFASRRSRPAVNTLRLRLALLLVVAIVAVSACDLCDRR